MMQSWSDPGLAALLRRENFVGQAKKSSLFTSPIKAAHPGGSARFGKVVDKNLETQIKNCYVADASVVPDELGTPVVFLSLCIGKYASKRMLENWS
jgi:choline dehydrogenase-like flavoprotein